MKSSKTIAQTAACSAFILAVISSANTQINTKTNAPLAIEKSQTVTKTK